MVHIERSALVSYSARQMFDLVNDIENYPHFMQGCQDARVISRSEHEVTAELTLGKLGLKQSFTTLNTLLPYSAMKMQLVQGPFRHFSASWHFKELTESACKVSLQMEFEYTGGIASFALEKLFEHSANTLVDAVVERARRIYKEA